MAYSPSPHERPNRRAPSSRREVGLEQGDWAFHFEERVMVDVQGDRFWEKVDKDGPIPILRPDLGPCWIWLAATNRKGYGIFKVQGGRRTSLAHRIAYEGAFGNIKKPQLDHVCRNPSCVNPRHLEEVTALEHASRRITKPNCPNGHPFNEANTRVENAGGGYTARRCIACRRSSRARKAG